MNIIIRKLAIAIIPFIALTITISASHAIAHKVEHARCAAAVAAQSGPEMLNGSYNTMMNTLLATTVR